MASLVGYHQFMRRFFSASIACIGLIAVPVLVSNAHAQINGAPASVTSPGFGGRAINGTPASVTSLGPRGYAPGPGYIQGYVPGATFSQPNHPRNGYGRNGNGRRGDGRDGHRRNPYGQYYSPYLYYYGGMPYTDDGSPYTTDMGAPDQADYNGQDDAADYQGGPTIFDRRGSGARSYVPPVAMRPRSDQSPQDSSEAAIDSAPEQPQQPQEPTLLVFKDGHKLQVENYAIVGPTLFDLTPGHRRKVALADLNLHATEKENDDNGVIFRLPPGAQAN